MKFRMQFLPRNPNEWIYLLLIACILLPRVAVTNWMYLGVASMGAVHDDSCNTVPGLVFQQLELCKNNPKSMWCISEGARRGITECQQQFMFERWNCTAADNQTVFGEVLVLGTRETAFIYAVLSAGVVHAVTQSCSAGNLTDCSCDISRQGRSGKEGWTWGGCSDNVKYGIWFSKTFVDAPETLRHQANKNLKNLMNLHNNEAGRRIVQNHMHKQCRCHGVSGSCTVKTCWSTMPTFQEIGKLLKHKYESSVPVAPRSRRKLRTRSHQYRKRIVSKEDLVHLHTSPNYCKENQERGILGTRGRECNRTSVGGDSCDLLCCGRGYNTQVVRHVERCHCKFHWCCYVTCKTCITMIERYTCK